MKTCITIVTWLLATLSAFAQTANPRYNKTLADSLKADEYGMKMYVLVILKTGSNKTADKAKQDNLFQGHMANIGKLAKEGKLVVAGPLKKNDKEYRGIFILNAASLDEAKTLLDTDPAIREKLLDAELYQWYGSAALPLYLQYHDVVGKSTF
jgi:uncharacterized protein YciI